MLKLSIIHYLALSLATCHIAPIHTERVDFRLKVLLTFDGKGGRWGVFFERLSFNVERRGMENKYSGMLAWGRVKINMAECLHMARIFCIFESTRRYFHSLQKNIQASLILFHSFITIFDVV